MTDTRQLQEASPPQAGPTRLRGVIYIIIAILLLLSGFLVFAILLPSPDAGETASFDFSARILIIGFAAIGHLLLLMGAYRIIVGRGGGPHGHLLQLLGVCVVVSGLAVGGLIGVTLTAMVSMEYEHNPDSDDWDWD